MFDILNRKALQKEWQHFMTNKGFLDIKINKKQNKKAIV